jgi:hypothetical protein
MTRVVAPCFGTFQPIREFECVHATVRVLVSRSDQQAETVSASVPQSRDRSAMLRVSGSFDSSLSVSVGGNCSEETQAVGTPPAAAGVDR